MARGQLRATDVAAIEQKIQQEIQDAIAFAESGTWEPAEDLARFVYTK